MLSPGTSAHPTPRPLGPLMMEGGEAEKPEWIRPQELLDKGSPPPSAQPLRAWPLWSAPQSLFQKGVWSRAAGEKERHHGGDETPKLGTSNLSGRPQQGHRRSQGSTARTPVLHSQSRAEQPRGEQSSSSSAVAPDTHRKHTKETTHLITHQVGGNRKKQQCTVLSRTWE